MKGQIEMQNGSMPFYEVRNVKDNQIIESDIWSKEQAIKLADTMGKSKKVALTVYQLKQVHVSKHDTVEIEF